jgi:hypothetical protein
MGIAAHFNPFQHPQTRVRVLGQKVLRTLPAFPYIPSRSILLLYNLC